MDSGGFAVYLLWSLVAVGGEGMLKAGVGILALAALAAGAARGQDPAPGDAGAVKQRLLRELDRRLAEERRRILSEVGKILDEELRTEPGPAETAEERRDAEKGGRAEGAERRRDAEKGGGESELDAVSREMEETRARLEALKRRKEALERGRRGEPAPEERGARREPRRPDAPAGEEPAMTMEEAALLFQKSMAAHEKGNFEKSIPGFQKIFEALPDEETGVASAYNVACGYARMGRKDEAVEWLAKAVEAGFRDAEHIEGDADLDNIREEEGYREILRKLKTY